MLAAFPNFMKKEGSHLIGTAVQVVLNAPFFLAGGSDESAQFRFKKHVLAFFGAQRDHQGQCSLGKFGDFGAVGLAAGSPFRGFLRFSFGHVGGDFTPIGRRRNGNSGAYFSALMRPTFRLSKFRRVFNTSE